MVHYLSIYPIEPLIYQSFFSLNIRKLKGKCKETLGDKL